MNIRQLRQLPSCADGLNLPSDGKQSFCEACVGGKMHHLSHPSLKEVRSTEKL